MSCKQALRSETLYQIRQVDSGQYFAFDTRNRLFGTQTEQPYYRILLLLVRNERDIVPGRQVLKAGDTVSVYTYTDEASTTRQHIGDPSSRDGRNNVVFNVVHVQKSAFNAPETVPRLRLFRLEETDRPLCATSFRLVDLKTGMDMNQWAVPPTQKKTPLSSVYGIASASVEPRYAYELSVEREDVKCTDALRRQCRDQSVPSQCINGHCVEIDCSRNRCPPGTTCDGATNRCKRAKPCPYECTNSSDEAKKACACDAKTGECGFRPCSEKNPCPDGYQCGQDGRCERKCKQACGSDKVCRYGYCVNRRCKTYDECPEGWHCDGTGQCVPLTKPDGSCLDGHQRLCGKCVPPPPSDAGKPIDILPSNGKKPKPTPIIPPSAKWTIWQSALMAIAATTLGATAWSVSFRSSSSSSSSSSKK